MRPYLLMKNLLCPNVVWDVLGPICRWMDGAEVVTSAAAIGHPIVPHSTSGAGCISPGFC